MTWAEFKNLSVGEMIDLVQILKDPPPGAMLGDKTLSEGAKELVIDFVDRVILRFPEGSLYENLSDTGLAMLDQTTDWEERAGHLLGIVVGFLDAKPLEHLPV